MIQQGISTAWEIDKDIFEDVSKSRYRKTYFCSLQIRVHAHTLDVGIHRMDSIVPN